MLGEKQMLRDKEWCWTAIAGGLMLAGAMVSSPVGAGEVSKETMDTVNALLDPFWKSTTMRGESLFFGQKKAGDPLEARLFFPPEAVASVKSATGEVTYEEGKDYAVDKAAGVIRLLPGSRIPSKKPEEMYPLANSSLPKYAHKRGDPGTHLIFGEGSFFHKLQVEVTYTHAAGLWPGYVPKFSGDALPGTLKKLRAKEPLKLCVAGDSISAGYNASKMTQAPPFMPCYGELVALGLEKVYGSKVSFRNFAVGGWTSDSGLAAIDKVSAEKPDLVIIAFGMNDSGKAPAKFAANIKAMMDKVRAASPEAEFVLVASMLPNPEWLANSASFPPFRDELAKLCGRGAALADLTAVWTEMLKRKGWHDLTGNGVNHPNDFGHRLYAQVILGLLVEEKAGK
jgi:acyl-CoA thioesterase-1